MEVLDFVQHVYSSLDEKKAEDIVVLDIRNLSSIADYFVIASADSERGVRSLAENLSREIKKKFKIKVKIDGADDSRWVIIDNGDAMVHIFHSETRALYDIESLWYEAKKVSGL